jgi:hypothetical protein
MEQYNFVSVLKTDEPDGRFLPVKEKASMHVPGVRISIAIDGGAIHLSFVTFSAGAWKSADQLKKIF